MTMFTELMLIEVWQKKLLKSGYKIIEEPISLKRDLANQPQQIKENKK